MRSLSLTGGQVDVEALEALLEAVAGQQVAVDGVVLALQVVQLDEVVTDHAVHLCVGEASFRISHYTEAKVDVTEEIEQRAQWSAPAWAACCALCSISCDTSTLASV